MLGQAKPYFTLVKESSDRAEVERAAEDYKRQHPGVEVVVDSWRDHISHNSPEAIWRARARIIEQRSFLARFFSADSR